MSNNTGHGRGHGRTSRSGSSSNSAGNGEQQQQHNTTTSYSPSIPYNRLANAAVAAASPIIGYLSGHSQQDNAGPSRSTPYSITPSSQRASNAMTGADISATAAMSGSPGFSTAPLPSTSSSGGAAAGSSSTSRNISQAYDQQHRRSVSSSASNTPGPSEQYRNYQQPPPRSPQNPQYIQQQQQQQLPSSSSSAAPSGRPSPSTTPSAINMRRTSSIISDEDARKKESRNLDSIVSQFFSKAAQVITQARFTHVNVVQNNSGSAVGGTSLTAAGKRSRNRWFNLDLEESDIFKDELKTWRSVTSLLAAASSSSVSSLSSSLLPTGGETASSESPTSTTSNVNNNYNNIPNMVIEIILDVSDISPNQVLVLNDTKQNKRFRVDLSGKGRTTHLHNPASALEGSPRRRNIVLERWTLALNQIDPTPGSLELPTVYRHCIILFRALYTLVRTLPIFELHRRLKRRTGRSEIKIGCRLSCRLSTDDGQGGSSTASTNESDDAEQENMGDNAEIGLNTPLGDEDDASFSILDFAFAPIITPIGALDLRCRYRACVDFSVEEIEALLSSRFIDEDFFKPTMRKYSSSSTPGSVPVRGSEASPSSGYSRSQTRPSYGGLSVPRSISQPVPTSTSLREREATDEGAFIGSYGKGKGPEVQTRGSPAPEMTRRPSIGGAHPFKPMSASPSATGARNVTNTPAQDLAARYSSSPSSIGPSSSLRYSVGQAHRSPSLSGGTGGMSGAPSVSQISYTKRSIPSPTNAGPPISALTAMQVGSSPSPHISIPGAQPMPFPGTSAIPLSTSPTPSLIKRYSTSRYSRSFGQGSSGSSPGEPHGFWGPESMGRRSRLSSGQSREDLGLNNTTTGGTATLAEARQHQQASLNATDISGDAQDADQIKSFLGMIDSRAQLPGGSLLLGGGSPGRALAKSATLNRLNAEEKLRNLADSVLRDSTPRSGSSASSHSSGAQGQQYPRYASTSYGQTHNRSRSGEFVASMPTSSRQSPSPDLYSASPVEGGQLYGAVAAARPRISQPPMSTSIPEEDPHHHHHSQTARTAQPTAIPPPRSSESSSLAGSNTGSFPFPRYVSSSMRKRGSSQSQSSSSRLAINTPPPAVSQIHSPNAGSSDTALSSQQQSLSSHRSSGLAGRALASPVPGAGATGSLEEEEHERSMDSSHAFEGGEEAAVAQLELGTDSSENVSRSGGGSSSSGRHSQREEYRWGG